jgi:hypothetical protein
LKKNNKYVAQRCICTQIANPSIDRAVPRVVFVLLDIWKFDMTTISNYSLLLSFLGWLVVGTQQKVTARRLHTIQLCCKIEINWSRTVSIHFRSRKKRWILCECLRMQLECKHSSKRIQWTCSVTLNKYICSRMRGVLETKHSGCNYVAMIVIICMCTTSAHIRTSMSNAKK